MKLLLLSFLLLSICFAQFSLETAKNTIFLSYAAYCGNGVDSNWKCYWCEKSPGFTWISNFGDTKTGYFGFVGYHQTNKTIFVVFRGTDNLKGWIDDFTFIKVKYGNIQGAEVHSGIYNAFLKVKDDIRNLYGKAVSRCPFCNRVIVTGHSLGAGLATFGGLDMINYVNNKSLTVYHYGSPRIGNQNFANYANSKVDFWRITKDRDPVPHVPWRALNFYHVSSEVFERSGSYRSCTGGEDPNCSNSIKLTNPLDHGEYMDVQVLEGIKYGCFYNSPPQLSFMDEI